MKIGDKVKLHRCSRYYKNNVEDKRNPRDLTGVVSQVDHVDEDDISEYHVRPVIGYTEDGQMVPAGEAISLNGSAQDPVDYCESLPSITDIGKFKGFVFWSVYLGGPIKPMHLAVSDHFTEKEALKALDSLKRGL